MSPWTWASFSHLHKGSVELGLPRHLCGLLVCVDGLLRANDSSESLPSHKCLQHGSLTVGSCLSSARSQAASVSHAAAHLWLHSFCSRAVFLLHLWVSHPPCRQEEGGKAKGMAHWVCPFLIRKTKTRTARLSCKELPGR